MAENLPRAEREKEPTSRPDPGARRPGRSLVRVHCLVYHVAQPCIGAALLASEPAPLGVTELDAACPEAVILAHLWSPSGLACGTVGALGFVGHWLGSYYVRSPPGTIPGGLDDGREMGSQASQSFKSVISAMQ